VKPKQRLIVGVLLGIPLLLFFLGLTAKPGLVAYHRWAMIRARNKGFQGLGLQGSWVQVYEKHRKSLISLGYYQEKILWVKLGDKEFEALVKDFGLPGERCFCAWRPGPEPGSMECEIIAVPDEMTRVLEIFRQHGIDASSREVQEPGKRENPEPGD